MTIYSSIPHAPMQYTYRMLDSWRDLGLGEFVALTGRSDEPALLYHGLRRFIAPMPQDCVRQDDGTWQATFGRQVLATGIASHDQAFRTLSTWFNATYPATLGDAKRMLAGEGEGEARARYHSAPTSGHAIRLADTIAPQAGYATPTVAAHRSRAGLMTSPVIILHVATPKRPHTPARLTVHEPRADGRIGRCVAVVFWVADRLGVRP